MKVNNEEFIALCATHGIEGIDIVNELMRFKVLDQLISSNASSREWGVTADDLYALAEKSTVESFGPVPYDLNTFQALYGPSFRVELFDFISDTGILDGLDVGTIWETPVRESIEAHSKTGELVLYAYVEEYAGMIEEILQSYEDKKVVLYTASLVCYSILTRLYPMAQLLINGLIAAILIISLQERLACSNPLKILWKKWLMVYIILFQKELHNYSCLRRWHKIN